jgi:hypothetical protein
MVSDTASLQLVLLLYVCVCVSVVMKTDYQLCL